MADNWEDLENEDFVVLVASALNVEQLKRIEERKFVEESDNLLTKSLFNNEEDFTQIKLNNSKQNSVIKPLQINETKRSKKVSNKQTNEEKQKEFSQKIKEDKLKRVREKELYGETEEDEYEYSKYEDEFY